ncbi:hypothetical protein [Bradyrhizobium sp. NFR13]|uniref:hypothetical protein n=1 Tax=Bradyrhizobium sp. NFR13 TaxID=1566285 RepID=UPI0015879917|nr:hypothetical protein [Bradyrhizobium sp. NFR13]
MFVVDTSLLQFDQRTRQHRQRAGAAFGFGAQSFIPACAPDNLLDQIQFAFDDFGDTLNQWTARPSLRPIIGRHVVSRCVINCIGQYECRSFLSPHGSSPRRLSRRAGYWLSDHVGNSLLRQSLMPD